MSVEDIKRNIRITFHDDMNVKLQFKVSHFQLIVILMKTVVSLQFTHHVELEDAT